MQDSATFERMSVRSMRSNNVLEYIAESKRREEFTCLFTLDILSVFNSIRRTDILLFLEELGVKPYLLGVIDDYLWYRLILLNEGEHYFNVGVLQGSYLNHLVWLVVINNFLRHLAKTQAWVVQSFIDDVSRIPAVYIFADVLGKVFAKFHCWTTTSNLEFNYI